MFACQLLVSSYGHLASVKGSFGMSESFSLGHFGWTRGTFTGHFFGKACVIDTIEVSGASPQFWLRLLSQCSTKGEKNKVHYGTWKGESFEDHIGGPLKWRA